ncbi:hypothetical protein P153DRAFT_407833 [Dothidotthia symphoricarpi CBS 119687]|uniref:Uncharacterized protein n=1 Tax=Dothidotthia symphoricarpi CBS 119687 TaxID=1392245 RepID=A0A6A6A755_9PLEO|nr:uncharacterized protein P153DRAFT_407833 [Dothidotthia symphoricarpi CBS 119687]KAF2126637.1 hypothetical protein P153DRAFT_407833 [Dothidotthia symphoricarpi CBS 119687]
MSDPRDGSQVKDSKLRLWKTQADHQEHLNFPLPRADTIPVGKSYTDTLNDLVMNLMNIETTFNNLCCLVRSKYADSIVMSQLFTINLVLLRFTDGNFCLRFEFLQKSIMGIERARREDALEGLRGVLEDRTLDMRGLRYHGVESFEKFSAKSIRVFCANTKVKIVS